MTLGTTPRQGDLFRSTVPFCAGRVPEDSIYSVLHREGFGLFPDSLFADLFTDVGRRCVPPMIVATVMVLQRVEGLSDRAVSRSAIATASRSRSSCSSAASREDPITHAHVRQVWLGQRSGPVKSIMGRSVLK